MNQFLSFYEELLNTLTRRLGCRYQAEDVAHEAYLRVMERESGDVREPRAYLHRAALNIVVDEHRRRSAIPFCPLDSVAEDFSAHDEIEATTDAARSVDRLALALAELPLKCRQVFIWSRVDGVRQREIAKRLGISLNMVEKYMIRASLHLRERL